MNLIKCRFLKDGKPTGKPYTYDSPVAVKPGDIVQIGLCHRCCGRGGRTG